MSAPRKVTEPSREIDVIHETDVLVVGSGPGGLAAALAAARAGVQVALVERFGCFGGNITTVGVEGFMVVPTWPMTRRSPTTIDIMVNAKTSPAAVTTAPLPAIARMMPVFSPACASSLSRDTSSRL